MYGKLNCFFTNKGCQGKEGLIDFSNQKNNLYLFSEYGLSNNIEGLKAISLHSLGDCNRILYIKEYLAYIKDSKSTVLEFMTILSFTMSTKELINVVFECLHDNLNYFILQIAFNKKVYLSDFSEYQFSELSFSTLVHIHTKFSKEENILQQRLSELENSNIYINNYYLPEQFFDRLNSNNLKLSDCFIETKNDVYYNKQYALRFNHKFDNELFKEKIKSLPMKEGFRYDISNKFLTYEQQKYLDIVIDNPILNNLVVFTNSLSNDVSKILTNLGVIYPSNNNMFEIVSAESTINTEIDKFYKYNLVGRTIKDDFCKGHIQYDLDTSIVLCNSPYLNEIYLKHKIHSSVFKRTQEINSNMVYYQYLFYNEKVADLINISTVIFEKYHLKRFENINCNSLLEKIERKHTDLLR